VLPFIIAGLTMGSIFSLAAVGLVLSYKTSGIFNFAHGALASVSAFLFFTLHVQHGLPWPVAAALCVFGAGPVLGLLLEALARRLAARTLPIRVVGTVGLLLLIQGGLSVVYDPGVARSVPQFLPTGAFTVLGTRIEFYRAIIFGAVLIAVIALTLFLRSARLGTAMRAVVDDPDLLDISGTSPVRVRRVAWLIGSCTVSASGVLLAPLLPLDITTFTLLVVTAFGAAAVGTFTNLPLTYVGGLAIGIGEALLQKYFQNSSGLAGGLSSALPFLVLFILLLAAPRLRSPSAIRVPQRLTDGWRAPVRVRVGGLASVLIVLVLVPRFAGFHIGDWTVFLTFVILFLSLGLLVRMSGQVSLAHVSFMAIGAVTVAHLTTGQHWPWLPAVLGSLVVAAPIGALLAIPAIRFPGLYLALATLGFGILLQYMFYGQGYMFGTLNAGLTIKRPHLGGLSLDSDSGFYYVVLACAVGVAALVVLVDRSRLGRLLRALSDSPAGLAASGASINVSRVLVFSLSAALAAFAGALQASSAGFIAADSFQPITSLQLFVLVVIAVGDLPWYALTAAAGQILIPSYISVGSATFVNVLTMLFGVGAIQYAVSSKPPAVPARIRAMIDTAGLGRQSPAAPGPQPAPIATDADAADAAEIAGIAKTAELKDSRLDIQDITVRYGGLVAADSVTLSASAGRITGLIGPNGAGKTTVFNACAGTVRPRKGTVVLDGRGIDRLGVPARARRGLGRTFQRVELFDSLTVAQNVALGCEGHYAGWNPLGHVLASRPQQSLVRQQTDYALTLCGLDDLRERNVGSLSTGQRRLVELARVLAGPFRLLLLDEPSSGLDLAETERFGDVLSAVVRERGLGVLLVEHDMALVNRLCDYVYVLDFGKQIFSGTVAEVGASPVVRSAYLGEDGMDLAGAKAAKK
jgi:ABC-type branched-subunit amino acid transport system ATPase component/branched-subunit amino acid ABC-type transport system permease component